MNINTSKSVKYLIGLCVAGLFACGVYVSLAYANVCFLPSGICDFGESEVHEFVFTEPQGECTGDIEQDKSKCCLLSPLPYFKCEQCDNGRFKCEEQCISNDFQLITKHGTRRSECVCKGDACGSIPTANNNKDLRDKHCSVSLNSCGLCPEGKCVCNGEKCSDKNNGNKIYACTTDKTNNCGNCPTDRGASCECVNCCDVFGTDWYSDTDRKCKLINHTKNNSTCYKPYDCTCPEDFPGSQKGDDCPTGQMADFISNAENGDACYECRSKSCADYSDNNVTYHESYSDRNETCQDYETVRLNDRTCYVYTNRSCEVVYAGYSGASLFLNNANLREGYSDCYSFTEKQDCKNYVGSCFLGRKKSCTERGLLSSQPSGKVCDAISACDMTCFDPNTCRVPGPGCIENGGKFNKSELDCDEACIIETSFPQDEGKPCFMCEAGCDPCKKINSAYRSSANDPCENGQCCQGKWSEVTDDSAIGSRKCYKCKSCEEINSNYHTGQVTDCKTQNIKVSNTNGCYVCPNCFQYGVAKRVYSISASQTKYPAYQENKCGADKIQIEVPDTNKCYQCPSCSEFNSQWQSESSCTDGKVAKPVIGHPQCKKCVKCPDNTWTTNKPSSGEYLTWTDEDTGFTCYKSGTCADYSQEESASACDSNKCYKANEHDHNGLKCYTCDKPRTCAEIHNGNPAYAHDVIYDEDKTGIGNLTCTKITDCGKNCWACHEPQPLQCPMKLKLPINTGTNGNQTTLEYVYWTYDPNITDCPDESPDGFHINVKTMHTTITITAESGDSVVCPYRYCEPDGCSDLGYLESDEIYKCTREGIGYYRVPGVGFKDGDGCYACKDCVDLGYLNTIPKGKETEKNCACTGYNESTHECTGYDETNCETRIVEKFDYPCPSKEVAQYQGVPVTDDRYPGLQCYTCPPPKPTCADKGYREVGEQCPPDKPSRQEKWIDEIEKECLICSDCPTSLPRKESFNNNRDDVCEDWEDLLPSYALASDKQSWLNANISPEEAWPDFLECVEVDSIQDDQCCKTCLDINGHERCSETAPKAGTCGKACAEYNSIYKEVDEGCPDGEKPYKVWIQEINRQCIYNCVPEDPEPSSSGGGGGGGGGGYYQQDSWSDLMDCSRCCTKEISSTGEKLVVKIGAPGQCKEICNEARCCYQTPGNEHNQEDPTLICPFESLANSGTCNPMDSGLYFKCPNGYTCVPDPGAASSFEGHCLQYNPNAESANSTQQMPQLEIPDFTYSPGAICGDKGYCSSGQKCCRWSVWTDYSCANPGINMFWKCQSPEEECKNKIASCLMGSATPVEFDVP